MYKSVFKSLKSSKRRATSPINTKFANLYKEQINKGEPSSHVNLCAHLCCCFVQTCHLRHSKLYVSCNEKLLLPWLLGFGVVDRKSRTLSEERLGGYYFV